MRLTPQDIIEKLGPINTLIESIFKQLLIGETTSLKKIKETLEKWLNVSKNHDDKITDLDEKTFQTFIKNTNQTLLDHLDAAAYYYQLNWRANRTPSQTFLEVNQQWESFKVLITPAIQRMESAKDSRKTVQIFDCDDLSQVRNPLFNFQLQRLKHFFKEVKDLHHKLTEDEQSFKIPFVKNLSTHNFFSKLTKYQAETTRARQVISKISPHILAHNSDLSDQTLINLARGLCLAIQRLETCNRERKKIFDEMDAVYPQTDDETKLQSIEEADLKLLIDKLEGQLRVFIQINIKKNNLEMAFYTNLLMNFVSSLTEALTTGKYPIGNDASVKLLKKALYHHAGESSGLIDFYSKPVMLEATPSCVFSLTQDDLTQLTINPNELVVKIEKDRSILSRFKKQDAYILKYAVLDPYGKRQIETLTASDLPFISTLTSTATFDDLILYWPDILAVTTRRNHTRHALDVLIKNLIETKAKEKPSVSDKLLSNFQKKDPGGNISLQKEKIAQIRCTLRILTEFPMDEIANCFLIQANIAQQRTTIVNNNALIKKQLTQLQQKITGFLKQITTDADPIPATGFNTTLKTRANERCNQLKALQRSLDNNSEHEMFLEHSVVEIKSIAQVKQLQQETETTLDQQQDLLKKLQIIEQDIQENEINKLLSSLKTFFQNKKKQYQTELNQEINDAQAALLFETNQSKLTATIIETLRPSNDFSKDVPNRQDSLACIFDDVKQQITTLQKLTENVKKGIKTRIIPELKELDKLTNQCPSEGEIRDKINPINPFLNDLIDASEKTKASFAYYQRHTQQLDSTRGIGLNTWQQNYCDKKNAVSTQIQFLDRIDESADEIENRLKTDFYKTSNQLLTELKLEYVRIFDKYIDSSRTKKLSRAQKIELQQQRDSLLLNTQGPFKTSESIHSKLSTPSLDNIDIRLNKLIAIYSDFKETNQCYISKNPNCPSKPYPLSNKAYGNQLISKIKTHLLNSDMEDISDGVNSKFFQWIRRHILRPLETLVHAKTTHFFTVGACATEKALINLGNNLYEKLTTSMRG